MELALQWDIYVASSLRYRIEIHTPSLTLGPVVGIKWKLLALRPFDRFLDDPDSVRGYFYVLGINFSLPMSRSLFVLEIDLLTNDQSIITIDAGIHLLL